MSAARKKKVGVLGSIAFDHIFRTDGLPRVGERVNGTSLGKHFGGMAANQAVQAAKMMGEASLIGKIGNDNDGRLYLAEMERQNVRSDFVFVSSHLATGKTYMFLREDKDYFSVVDAGANEDLTSLELETALMSFAKGDILLVQLEINTHIAEFAMRTARRMGLFVVLCGSPAKYLAPSMYDNIDVLIVNQHEADELWGLGELCGDDAALQLRRLPLRDDLLVVITLGAEGSIAKQGENVIVTPTALVKVIDTVGAGDALAGAFCASLAMGFDIRKALIYGNLAGALAVTKAGAQSSLPSFADIVGIYQSNPMRFEDKII
jgi:ribokinase